MVVGVVNSDQIPPHDFSYGNLRGGPVAPSSTYGRTAEPSLDNLKKIFGNPRPHAAADFRATDRYQAGPEPKPDLTRRCSPSGELRD